MTFDAGSIEATADIDLTPFQRGLALARQEARAFTEEHFRVRIGVDLDTAAAEAKLAALRRQLSDRDSRIRIETDTRGLDQAARHVDQFRQQTRGAKKDVEEGLKHPLLDLAATVGTGLIPLAGGMAGLLASVAGFAAVLPLAVKGARKEMAAGTSTGKAYSASIATIKTNLDELERTAAKGVLAPFQKTITNINKQAPQLNAFVARLSGPVGATLSSLADGLIHLFTAAEPLIQTAVTDVGALVDRFDRWAQGPSGANFFAALQRDIPLATTAIGNLVSIAGHLITGLEPVGELFLHLLNGVTTALDAIPQPVLTAILTVLVGWRVNALLAAAASKVLGTAAVTTAAAITDETGALAANTGALIANNLAARALLVTQLGLTTASGGALGALGAGAAARSAAAAAAGGGALPIAGAAGAGGLLARSGVLLRKAIPPLLALAVTGVITDQLAKATKDWNYSGNSLKAGTHQGLDLATDIFTAPFNGFSFSRTKADNKAQQDFYNMQASQAFEQKYANDPTSMRLRNAGLSDQHFAPTREATHFSNTLNAAEGSALGATNFAQASDASDKLTNSLQKQIDAQSKLFDTSGRTIKLANGLTVSWDAYKRVNEQLGHNINAVDDYFQKHDDVLDQSKRVQADLQARQQNYGVFLVEAATKYKLTETQVQAFSTALGLNYQKITQTSGGAQRLGDVVSYAAGKFRNGNAALQTWLATISQLDTSDTSLNNKVTVLGAALQALNGITVSSAGVNLQAVSSAETLANTLAANHKVVGKSGELLGQLVKHGKDWEVEQPKLTAKSLQVQQAMASASGSAIQLAQSILQNTGSVSQAVSAYHGLRQQFIDSAAQMHLTHDQAVKLADSIYAMPDKKLVQFLKKDDISGAVSHLTSVLAGFSKNFENILVRLGLIDDASPAIERVAGLLRSLEGDHTVHVGGRTFGVTVQGAGGITQFAAGGMELHKPMIAKAQPNTVRVWAEPETLGEAYIPLANDWRRPRARAVASEAVRRIGGVAYFATPSLVTSGGSSSSGSSSSSSSSHHSAANTARSHRIDLLSSALLSALNALGGIAYNSATQIANALDTVGTRIRSIFDAGFTSRNAVRRFQSETGVIVAEAKRRDALLRQIGTANLPHRMTEGERLDAITNLTTTIRGGVLGRFDVGSSGNGYAKGILATLGQDQGDLDKFAALRNRAKSLGLSRSLVSQVTQDYANNPQAAAANLQAIVSGGKGYVAQLNAAYDKYRIGAGALADAQAKDTYGRTRTEEIAYIRRLMEREHLTQKEINDHLRDIYAEIKDLDKKLLAAKRAK